MKKNKLLSVKEFSAFSGIEQSTLRYWDEIGLFSPECRNEENNYRYYSPRQITTVKFIKVLSSLNIPLKTIRSLSNSRSPESIMALLKEHEKRLDMEMHRIHESYSLIHTFRDLIKDGLKADISQLSVCKLEEMPIIIGPKIDFSDGEQFHTNLTGFYKKNETPHINTDYPIGGYFETMDAFLENPSQPTNIFSINPAGHDIKPAGEYIVGYVKGYYGDMKNVPENIVAFAGKHGLEPKGPVYASYLHNELCVDDPSQYLARVSVMVSPPPFS